MYSAKYCLNIIILILLSVVCKTYTNTHWNYKDEYKWPETCIYGRHQSPINLQKDTAELRVFTDFQFNHYDMKFLSTLTNNGHSVALKLNASPSPSIKGAGLPHEYVVDHLHFHWESEHTIHSNRYPLELHVVHRANIFNSTEAALGYEQGLAVIAILFDISEEDNPIFEPMLPILKEIKNRMNEPLFLEQNISVSSFLPKNTDNFFRYEGSLTTPKCDEVVVWTVLYDINYISKNQLQHFSAIQSYDGVLEMNYRSLQKLNERVITFRSNSAPDFYHPTLLFHLILIAVSILY